MGYNPAVGKIFRKSLSEAIGDERKAKIYGYILPAVWSAIQAAGRAIRGPEDKAFVILADDRYKPLLKLFPRWFSERVVGSARLEDLPILLREAMRAMMSRLPAGGWKLSRGCVGERPARDGGRS